MHLKRRLSRPVTLTKVLPQPAQDVCDDAIRQVWISQMIRSDRDEALGPLRGAPIRVIFGIEGLIFGYVTPPDGVEEGLIGVELWGTKVSARSGLTKQCIEG